MEKLTLEEYKALGESIKQANKNLKLIRKLLISKEIDFISDFSEEGLEDSLGKMMCDLTNLSSDLERKMDENYPNVVDTIDFFN